VQDHRGGLGEAGAGAAAHGARHARHGLAVFAVELAKPSVTCDGGPTIWFRSPAHGQSSLAGYDSQGMAMTASWLTHRSAAGRAAVYAWGNLVLFAASPFMTPRHSA